MKRNHRVLWPALTIAFLILTTLSFAASHKLRGEPLSTTPLCRNGYRLIQQQQDDPRDRCLLFTGQSAKKIAGNESYGGIDTNIKGRTMKSIRSY